MFETLQGHRLATQRRWQTVPWRGTRRRKRAVTECDCLRSGDHQFVVVSWSQPGPASNRRDWHAESSKVHRRPALKALIRQQTQLVCHLLRVAEPMQRVTHGCWDWGTTGQPSTSRAAARRTDCSRDNWLAGRPASTALQQSSLLCTSARTRTCTCSVDC